jgi:hypothetical protein
VTQLPITAWRSRAGRAVCAGVARGGEMDWAALGRCCMPVAGGHERMLVQDAAPGPQVSGDEKSELSLLTGLAGRGRQRTATGAGSARERRPRERPRERVQLEATSAQEDKAVRDRTVSLRSKLLDLNIVDLKLLEGTGLQEALEDVDNGRDLRHWWATSAHHEEHAKTAHPDSSAGCEYTAMVEAARAGRAGAEDASGRQRGRHAGGTGRAQREQHEAEVDHHTAERGLWNGVNGRVLLSSVTLHETDDAEWDRNKEPSLSGVDLVQSLCPSLAALALYPTVVLPLDASSLTQHPPPAGEERTRY